MNDPAPDHDNLSDCLPCNEAEWNGLNKMGNYPAIKDRNAYLLMICRINCEHLLKSIGLEM